MNSRQRSRQKRREAYENRVAELRASGASCANCRSLRKSAELKKHYCEADSDFHGYAITEPSSICDKWTSKVALAIDNLGDKP